MKLKKSQQSYANGCLSTWEQKPREGVSSRLHSQPQNRNNLSHDDDSNCHLLAHNDDEITEANDGEMQGLAINHMCLHIFSVFSQ